MRGEDPGVGKRRGEAVTGLRLWKL